VLCQGLTILDSDAKKSQQLGQGFTSTNDLVEVDIGSGDRQRPTFLSAKLYSKYKQQITDLLREYKDCLTWDYTEMPGLD